MKTIRCSIALIIGCFLVVAGLSRASAGGRTFSIARSVLLFGSYNRLHLVTPTEAQIINPPKEVGYNHGYFVYPSLNSQTGVVAWGFATQWEEKRERNKARFSVGIYIPASKQWKTYGDFDDVGTPVFSQDGRRLAFVAEDEGKLRLLVLELSSGALSDRPYPAGMADAGLSWSPDGERLAVQFDRGDDSDLAVLDINTGTKRILGRGVLPAWSPDGVWIAYYDPEGKKCMVVRPDGTGLKVVRQHGRNLLGAERRFGYAVVWSPDGKHLLVNEIKGDGPTLDIVQVEVESGRTTRECKDCLPVFAWVPQN